MRFIDWRLDKEVSEKDVKKKGGNITCGNWWDNETDIQEAVKQLKKK